MLSIIIGIDTHHNYCKTFYQFLQKVTIMMEELLVLYNNKEEKEDKDNCQSCNNCKCKNSIEFKIETVDEKTVMLFEEVTAST